MPQTVKANLSLKKLSWIALGRYEQLDETHRKEVQRTRGGVMGLVHCVTQDMVTPKARVRDMLEDFCDYLVTEFRASKEVTRPTEKQIYAKWKSGR